MEDKIVLKVPKIYTCKLTGVIRLTPEAEMTLQKISEDTGLSIRYIASEMIIQGKEFIRLEEE